jgi:hypothetical protein
MSTKKRSAPKKLHKMTALPKKPTSVKLPTPETLMKAVSSGTEATIEKGRVVGPIAVADLDTEKEIYPPRKAPPYMSEKASEEAFFNRMSKPDLAELAKMASNLEAEAPIKMRAEDWNPGDRLIELVLALNRCSLHDVALHQLTVPTKINEVLCYPWEAVVRFAEAVNGPIHTLTGIATSPGLALVDVLNKLELFTAPVGKKGSRADDMLERQLGNRWV